MKKVLFALALIVSASLVATAQDKTTVVKNEKTTKNTSTVPQKVHNTFSKDKHYSGRKTKRTRSVKRKTDAGTAKTSTSTTTTTTNK